MRKIDKRRSIGLVAKEVDIQEHTIRFWETQFSQIKPTIGRGNRRYYFDKDIDTIQKIKYFLYDEGYTIKGLQKLLENKKHLLKKSLEEIKNTQGVGINIQNINKNLIVDTVCKLMNSCKKLEGIVKKIEEK
jgi:DNA-binding transcriptional MerR regulator